MDKDNSLLKIDATLTIESITIRPQWSTLEVQVEAKVHPFGYVNNTASGTVRFNFSGGPEIQELIEGAFNRCKKEIESWAK